MTKPTALKKNRSFSQVVVIGTSAGGLRAIIKLISQLAEDFPAPVLVVQHISADATGSILLDALNKLTKLKAVHATNGMQLQKGYVYLAPSDHHLMIDSGHQILVTKGASENRSRPAIDPLFRSAAVAFGNRVIGIILTGYLDDGTAGLKVIQRCGGICMVQEPADADYPEMPSNALKQVKADYCLPIVEMGSVLYQLMSRKPGKQPKIPKDILVESTIAERVLSDLRSVNALGEQVPFNCPDCGGVLWKMGVDPALRYRCHTGHAYTSATLLAEQTEKIEETMWIALRMFEERKNLLHNIAEKQRGALARSTMERASLTDVHINRIRAILQSDDKGTSGDSPT